MARNISKDKRNKLIKELEELRGFILKNIKDDNLIRLNEYIDDLYNDIHSKKYGLVYEEHEEKLDKLLKENVPILTEDKSLLIDRGKEVNFLIEGDNLASLYLLAKTHSNRIPLIYIDPPYNKGINDFIYDDNYVDVNDLFKHSKWISFMTERLSLARELLSEDGVIFISIDDIEQANLKLICDDIFGDSNFISNSFVLDNLKGKTNDKLVTSVGSRLYIYCKNKDKVKDFNKIENIFADLVEEKYKEEDEFGPYTLITFKKTGQSKKREDRPNMFYPILEKNGTLYSIEDSEFEKLYDKNTETFDDKYLESLKEKYKDYNFILPLDKKGMYLRWTSGFSTYKKLKNIKFIWAGDVKQKNRPKPQEMLQVYASGTPKSLMYKASYSTGTQDLDNIIPNCNFDFPKPVELIKDIMRLIDRKDITILDFFAGTGTTGQAVLELNKEDGGNRNFILCTNNENNICHDITYERIKTVITGKRKDGSIYSDGIGSSLKYFKVEYLPIAEKEYYEYADKLLLHVKELVELENSINFENNTEIKIILNEEELNNFNKLLVNSNSFKSIYLGHDILLSKEQKDLFAEKNISVKIIPEYYYPEIDG